MAENNNHRGPIPSVLVVDDDPTMRDVLEMRLQEWGFQVLLAADAREASQLVREENPDLVLSDVVIPEMSGLELLREMKLNDPDRPVLLLTAHATVEMAVEAIKGGALDFLTKPLSYPKLRVVLEQALRDRELLDRSRNVVTKLQKNKGFGPFVGTSPQMAEVYALIRDLAANDASVLITGESGTGKELAAQTIHDRSARSEKSFVAVNAAAIPRELVESELFGHERGAFTGASQDRMGCFELADGGTLLLDEIGEMPMELQPKLLRLLDEARFRRVGGKREITVNVRTISATNQDPREAVQEGTLREDLYYRLNVVTLRLPPLRHRTGDIGLMAQYYLDVFRRKHQSEARALREETLDALERYRWPGNVRELKNVMERAVILARGEWTEPSHLPPYIRDPAEKDTKRLSFPSGLTAAVVEKHLILQTLDETDNNKAEAARRLDLNVKTIRNKLKAYGIDR
jgi:DNA-binding NtrC family response regulator